MVTLKTGVVKTEPLKAIDCVEALVADNVTDPDKVPEADVVDLTQTVVLAMDVPEAGTVNELTKVDPFDETWKLAGAVTVTAEVKLDPVNVNVWALETEPEQGAKLVNVVAEGVITGPNGVKEL